MTRDRVAGIAWCALVVALVLLLPTSIIGVFPFWNAASQDVWLVVALSGVFVAGCLAEILSNRFRALPSVRNRFSVTILGIAAIFGTALMWPSREYSRALVAVAATLVVIGVVAPELRRLPKRAVVFIGVLSLALLACGPFVIAAIHSNEAENPRVQTKTIGASQHTLSVAYYSGYIPREPGIHVSGGAIASVPDRDGYVLVTARGQFFRIAWTASDELSATRLDFTVPINNDEFEADGNAPVAGQFRVADLALRRTGDGIEAFVSHHYWKRTEHCVVVRVSRISLQPDAMQRSEREWHTVFESTPCLPLAVERGGSFTGEQIGGNLEALASGQLLLALGDHQFDGWYRARNLVQDSGADYGKTLLIDPQTGMKALFSVGHRNPEGLVVGRDGRIWETEHGPQGGDELNLLVAGGNYGWPYRTLGTDYGSVTWTLSGKEPGPEVFIDPVFAWVPSIGVSELVEIDDPAFPRWQGDLLVSSLAARALWRVRIRHDRVEYAEPIAIGERIRDLAAGHGEFVLWTDSNSIVRIRPQATLDDGAALFTAHCGGCHDDQDNRIGPTLRHFLSRPVGSVEGYDYSPALRQLGGRWTDERLSQFLMEPGSVAPGTRMVIEGVVDPTARAEIIAYLKHVTR